MSKKRIFYTYLLAIIALVALPLNSANELNNITILQLRGDYFFHILMFLPWAFFHNTAAENLRLSRSFWFAAKSKETRKKSQQIIAHQ